MNDAEKTRVRIETIHSIVSFIISHNGFRFSRRPYTVVVYGGFAREARRAYWLCRQAVFTFLCVCHRVKVGRDIRRMICIPLLRTWFDDCAWFYDASMMDLDLKFQYPTTENDEPIYLFACIVDHFRGMVLEYLMSVQSQYKHIRCGMGNGEDYNFSRAGQTSRRDGEYYHWQWALTHMFGYSIHLDMVYEVTRGDLDMTVNGVEIVSNGGKLAFRLHEQILTRKTYTVQNALVTPQMVDRHLQTKTLALCRQADSQRQHYRWQSMESRGWKLSTPVQKPPSIPVTKGGWITVERKHRKKK